VYDNPSSLSPSFSPSSFSLCLLASILHLPPPPPLQLLPLLPAVSPLFLRLPSPLLSPTFFFLQLFSSLTMQSLVHTSQSWSAPVTRLWVGGGVELRQRVPLPATGRAEQYNTSLFNASSSFATDYDISTILSRYNARNGELVVIVLGFTQHAMASLQPCSQSFTPAPVYFTYSMSKWRWWRKAWEIWSSV